MQKVFLIIISCFFLFSGCEDTNIELATQAGLDALKAITLSDKDVKMLAVSASHQSDQKNQVAQDSNPYGRRLKKLVGNGHSFLSSHPDPDVRAKRIKSQVDTPESISEPGIFEKLINYILRFFK